MRIDFDQSLGRIRLRLQWIPHRLESRSKIVADRTWAANAWRMCRSPPPTVGCGHCVIACAPSFDRKSGERHVDRYDIDWAAAKNTSRCKKFARIRDRTSRTTFHFSAFGQIVEPLVRGGHSNQAPALTCRGRKCYSTWLCFSPSGVNSKDVRQSYPSDLSCKYFHNFLAKPTDKQKKGDLSAALSAF